MVPLFPPALPVGVVDGLESSVVVVGVVVVESGAAVVEVEVGGRLVSMSMLTAAQISTAKAMVAGVGSQWEVEEEREE